MLGLKLNQVSKSGPKIWPCCWCLIEQVSVYSTFPPWTWMIFFPFGNCLPFQNLRNITYQSYIPFICDRYSRIRLMPFSFWHTKVIFTVNIRCETSHSIILHGCFISPNDYISDSWIALRNIDRIDRYQITTKQTHNCDSYVNCGAVKTRSIFLKSPQKTPYSSPVRARYEVSFVGLHSDLHPDSLTAMMYAISCHIGLRYNDTRLYNQLSACNI